MSVHLDKKLYLVASLCDAVLNGAPGPSACHCGKPFVCQQQSPAGRKLALLDHPRACVWGWWRQVEAFYLNIEHLSIKSIGVIHFDRFWLNVYIHNPRAIDTELAPIKKATKEVATFC